jgi:hypothetical protein
MRSDEEPNDLVVISNADSSIRIRYAYRPKRRAGMKLLELKPRMRRIGFEATIGRASPVLNLTRQLREIAAERWM